MTSTVILLAVLAWPVNPAPGAAECLFNPASDIGACAPQDSVESAVRAAVEEFIIAWKAGDVARLKAVTAPEGSMVWLSGSGDSTRVRAQSFAALLENRRPQSGPYDLEEIRSLTVVDNQMASVEVAIRVSTGTFIDQYALYRVGGSWRVVTKTYVLRRTPQ
jgi:hypothetical protein